MTEHGGYTKLVKFEDIFNTTSHIARPILGLQCFISFIFY